MKHRWRHLVEGAECVNCKAFLSTGSREVPDGTHIVDDIYGLTVAQKYRTESIAILVVNGRAVPYSDRCKGAPFRK
jgi:hypothetical protein